MGKPLKNRKHEMFCKYYVTKLNGKIYNATEAAKQAGFSKKTAYSSGSRLLKRDDVSDRIDELKENAIKKLGLDQLYTLSYYKQIIEDDIRNYLSFKNKEVEFTDRNGEEDSYHMMDVDIKDSDDIDTWNISEISKGKDGQFKFKLHSKFDALEKLQKIIGIDAFSMQIELEKLAIAKMKADIGEDEEIEDDGFLEALEGQIADVWDDEEEFTEEVYTDGG